MCPRQFVDKIINQFNIPLTIEEIKTLLESFFSVFENDEDFSERDALLVAKLYFAKNSHDDIYKKFCEFRWRYISTQIVWRNERECIFCCDCGQETWDLSSHFL